MKKGGTSVGRGGRRDTRPIFRDGWIDGWIDGRRKRGREGWMVG